MSLSTTFLFFSSCSSNEISENNLLLCRSFSAARCILSQGKLVCKHFFSLFYFQYSCTQLMICLIFLTGLNLQLHEVFIYESTRLIYHFSRCVTLSGRRSKTVSSSIGLPATSSQYSSSIFNTGPMSRIWFPLMVRTFIMGRPYNTLISST